MAETATFHAWLESFADATYYEILRVDASASTEDVQRSFQALALRCHPDRFTDEAPELAEAAARVFRRVAEAYAVLRRPASRRAYDASLARGVVREGDVAATRAAVAPARPKPRLLGDIARSPQAKQHATRAERFLSIGDLEQARVALVSAVAADPYNTELEERLEAVHALLVLEPL